MAVGLNLTGKMYTNQTSEHETSISIGVKESGQYLVVVIPVQETGIINSTVEHNETVVYTGKLSQIV